ncbi:MAG: hypothetical protein V9G12_25620 [Microthrixaceae bacterium]
MNHDDLTSSGSVTFDEAELSVLTDLLGVSPSALRTAGASEPTHAARVSLVRRRLVTVADGRLRVAAPALALLAALSASDATITVRLDDPDHDELGLALGQTVAVALLRSGRSWTLWAEHGGDALAVVLGAGRYGTPGDVRAVRRAGRARLEGFESPFADVVDDPTELAEFVGASV